MTTDSDPRQADLSNTGQSKLLTRRPSALSLAPKNVESVDEAAVEKLMCDGEVASKPKAKARLRIRRQNSNGRRNSPHTLRASATGETMAGSQKETSSGRKNSLSDKPKFAEFHVARDIVEATQAAWILFVSQSGSQELVGEAVYSALFEAASSQQSLFTTPRAVIAMSLFNFLQNLVMSMDDQEELFTMVESLGFKHLHMDIHPDRIPVFREALLDLFHLELGELFKPAARKGLEALLTHTGKAIIYVRLHYAERLRIIRDSWMAASGKRAQRNTQSLNRNSGSGDSNGSNNSNKEGGGRHKHRHKVKDMNRLTNDVFDSDMSSSVEYSESDHGSGLPEKAGGHVTEEVSTSFPEMFDVTSAVMGFQDRAWMNEVLESFDAIVSNIANPARMQEESELLALRISKCLENGDEVHLHEFKACMLAVLRSLLPKTWRTSHEVAWTWLWDTVARTLSELCHLSEWQQALGGCLDKMSEADLYEMRRMLYDRFFIHASEGQKYFKQSNTRLHFIAEQMVSMTRELYRTPKQMISKISALGLRHVEFGIPTRLFAPFVTAFCDVVRSITDDEVAITAFRWSVALIAKILVRTITEGSTVVMKAINANNLKQLKKAADAAPRSQRAAWLLFIQVGTQSISPLSWAIESGSLDVAKEILVDLLTIRADRAKYYYGVDYLFGRHPDIVKRLVEDAAVLLPTFLEGLIWRSHKPDHGMRRCNYYIRHLLVDKYGDFADALKWLAATGEPLIIAQPVVALVSDTLWNGIVYVQFIGYKMWWILNLLIFMFAQGVLLRWARSDIEEKQRHQMYWAIAGCRTFIYLFGLGKLSLFHLLRIVRWCNMTMTRIFNEIDQDGSGTIEMAELWEASAAFKQSVQDEIRKALRFLRDDDGAGTRDEAKKAIATQSKSMVNTISFLLMLLLFVMAFLEPMLWCSVDPDADWPTDTCPYSQPLLYWYSVLSMAALIIHWLMLVDLAVFSTEVSAFLLVCGHVMSEVRQFLTALSFLLLTFGSSIPIFCSNCPEEAGNFDTPPRAIVSLFAITLAFFEADEVMDITNSEPVLLMVLLVFVALASILLLNLLIAQLNRSYEYIYQDMLGFARLNRASLIVDAMMDCGELRWLRFVGSLKLDEPIEFDPGDLGLPGGIQIMEHQSLHTVKDEQIVRYGGSTSPDLPWPESKKAVDDQDDRFDRLEMLFRKAMKRFMRMKGGDFKRQTSSSTVIDDSGSEDVVSQGEC